MKVASLGTGLDFEGGNLSPMQVAHIATDPLGEVKCCVMKAPDKKNISITCDGAK